MSLPHPFQCQVADCCCLSFCALSPAQVQFHAVALLHALRASDRLAISKLVASLTKANVKSPLAQCLLVRYVAQVSVEGMIPQPGMGGGMGQPSLLTHKIMHMSAHTVRARMPGWITKGRAQPASTITDLV